MMIQRIFIKLFLWSSLWPLLKGNGKDAVREVFYCYSGTNLKAVRKGNWKLVFPHTYNSNVGSEVGKDGWPGSTIKSKYEGGLYNLRRDPGERYDISREHPGMVSELEGLAAQMRLTLGDSSSGIDGKENRSPSRVNKW